MKSFVAILALVAVAAADVSHIVHNAGDAQIVQQDADVLPDKYQYSYETSNGIKGQEAGSIVNPGLENEHIAVEGANSYVGPDGQIYSIKYVANEFGYQAEGAHIPTPQPIPDYILRSLQYIETHAPKVVAPFKNQ